jgi:O-antigen/teichoic acid export membrane protein
VYDLPVLTPSRWGLVQIHNMKTNTVSAVTPAILALAAIVLSFRYMSASALIAGYFCVAGIAAIAAVEYRLNWKRFFSR